VLGVSSSVVALGVVVDDVSVSVQRVSASVTNVSSSLVGVSSSLTNVSNSVDQVSQSVVNISNSVQRVSGSLVNVSTSVVGLSTSLGAVSTSLVGVSTSIVSVSTSLASLNDSFNTLRGDYRAFKDETRRGIAAVAALGGLTNWATEPGEASVDLSFAGYKGIGAVGASFSYNFDNKTQVNVGVATSGGTTVFRVGVGFRFKLGKAAPAVAPSEAVPTSTINGSEKSK
jgi:hypothetical protein